MAEERGVDISLTMPDERLDEAYTGARMEAEDQALDEWWTEQLTPVPPPDIDMQMTPKGPVQTPTPPGVHDGPTPQAPPTEPAKPFPPGYKQREGTVSAIRADAGEWTREKLEEMARGSGLNDPGLTESIWSHLENKPAQVALQAVDWFFKVGNLIPSMARSVALPKDPKFGQAYAEWVGELPEALKPLVPGAYDPNLASTAQDLHSGVGTILELAAAMQPGADLVDYIPGLVRKLGGKADEALKLLKSEEGAISLPGGRAPQVAETPVNQLTLDPQRFQYKVQQGEKGTTGSLAGVQKYDPNLAGIIQAWKDPTDGVAYVVNGHNRVALAQRMGVDTIPVRYLDVQTAEEARTIGALTNIAEGRGSAIDAAKLFRDTGITRADLETRGIPLREKIATDGLALANLHDKLFQDAIQGTLPLDRAVIIGGRVADPDQQLKLVALLDQEAKAGRRLNNDTVRELADFVQASPSTSVSQESLFGAEEITQSLALDKARLAGAIREQISKDKSLFSRVSKESAAQRLTEAGTVVNLEESQRIAQESAQLLELFDRLKYRTGPIGDILNRGAEALHAGAKLSDVQADTYRQLSEAIPDALRSAESLDLAGATARGIPGEPTTSTGDLLSAGDVRTRGAVSESGVPIREAAPEPLPSDIPPSIPSTPSPALPEPTPRPMTPEAPAAQALLTGEGLEDTAARVNMARIAGSQRTKTVLETVNKLNVETGRTAEAVRGVVTHAETKTAAQGAVSVEQLLARQPGEMLPGIPLDEQITAARRLRVTSAKYLGELAERTARGDTEAANLLYEALAVHGKVDEAVTGMSAEIGRALSAHNIAATSEAGSINPQALAELADRLKGVTAEAGAGIPVHISPDRLAQMIVKVEREAGREGLNTFARQAVKPSFRDMLYEAWINGLLSNPQTHIVNVLSNSLTALWAIPERKLASMLHMDLAPGVEKGEATQMLYGLMGGMGDAFTIAAKAFREGAPVSGLSKLENVKPKAISGDTLNLTGMPGRAVDWIGNGVRTIGRTLIAEDEFFKVINYRMELHAQAYRQAVSEGLDGAEAARRVAQLIADPPATVQKAARDFAAYQTFNQELGQKAQAFADWVDLIPGGRLVLPFIRTPTNIAKYSFERIPGLNLLMGNVRADLKAGGAKRDMALAKMAMGSMAMATAATLAGQGLITGGGPKDHNLRQIWLRDHQPYSVKFPGGKTWYSYQRLDPLKVIFGTAANMAEIASELPTAELDQLALAAALSAGETLISSTYLTGLSNAFEAITSVESKGVNMIRNWSRSLVPAGIAAVGRATDPVQRQTRPSQPHTGWKAVDGMLTEMQSRVPGWKEGLPPRRNLFGEPIMYEGGFAQAMFSPIYTRTETNDPATQEILKHRVSLSMPSGVIMGRAAAASPFAEPDRTGVGVPLTPQEYDYLVRMAGNDLKLRAGIPGTQGKALGMHDALNALVQSSDYAKQSDGPDGGKAALIRKVVRAYRDAAEADLLSKDQPLQELVQQKYEERARAKMPLAVPGLSESLRR